MLTNKITGFSADLLNTVRGILGEAKKCPADCECEKCEAEEDDEDEDEKEMKEGSMPTADEPSAVDKKTADKVRAMMAKEKKPVKEGYASAAQRKAVWANRADDGAGHPDKKKKLKEEILEMVEEASSGLADKAKKSGVSLSTLKKVYARGIAAWNSGHRPGTTPQQWAHARVNSYITKGKGTYHGADKDLRSEGTDMPFEGPYKKVGERKDEYGNKVKNVAKFLAKKAMNKQKNEEVEQVDEISSDMAHRYLKGKRERDYDISADGKFSKLKKSQSFGKMNKDMTSTIRALRTIEKSKKTNEEAEGLDEISKATMGRYINKAKDSIDTASYRSGVKDAAGDEYKPKNPLERKLSKRHKGISTAVNKLTKEDAEQIDELSKDTMGRYINKAATKIGSQGVTAGLKIAADEKSSKNFKDMGKREKGIKLAVSKLTKEEQDFVSALNADTLDEARGRPRKAGAKDFTIHPKTKEKLMHNNPEHMKKIEVLQKNGILEKPKVEAGQHIMNQLRKAKTSMLGGSKINFTHGDSKEVSGTHAAKILTKYAGMKPDEKENFQKFVGHSHENLMKHV